MRRWLLLIGGLPWVLGILRWIKRLLEWGEHTEFIGHHLDNVARVWAMILEPPWWINIPLLIAGGGLIWWDLRGHVGTRLPRRQTQPTTSIIIPRKVSSTFGKMIFSCNDSRTEGQNVEQWRKDFEQVARVWGDAHGL